MARFEFVFVALVATALAAVVTFAYRSQAVKSRRADATDAVLDLASRQERHFLRCGNYAASIANATSCASRQLEGAAVSREGWYRLSLDLPDPATPRFIARAAAIAGGRQYQDTACRSFQVTQSGIRTAEDADGADMSEECWH